MATEEVPRIEVDGDRAHVTDFEITDSTVVEYLQQFDDERERKDAFVRALRVGVTTMDLAETSQQEEYVERKFTEMQRDLQEEIDRIEDEVEEKFGEDGERIQKALDPDTEGTPTYRLKRTLEDQIQGLRGKIEAQAAAEEAEEEIRQRTTLKGDDFEDMVENILLNLVYNTSNDVEYTGESVGEISGRKVGDFVVTLNDTGQ